MENIIFSRFDFNNSNLKLWPRRWFANSKKWRPDNEWEESLKGYIELTIPKKVTEKDVKCAVKNSGDVILHSELLKNEPDQFSLVVMSECDTILTGEGSKTWVIARIYYNGVPCRFRGVRIDFSTDNSIAYLPENKTVISNDDGQAWISLKATYIPGIVNITADAFIGKDTAGNNVILRASTQLRIVEWGTIFGTIYDQSGIGIPKASVTLYYTIKNNVTGILGVGPIVHIPENPQLSNDGKTSIIGRYIYYRVPSGDYCVVAEKDGHNYFTIVHLEKGTVTHDILLTDYISPVIKKSVLQTIKSSMDQKSSLKK